MKLLAAAWLAAMLLIAPLFSPACGDTIKVTGSKDGKTVLTLTTSLHGSYPLPDIAGVSYTVTLAPGDSPDPDPDDDDDDDDNDPDPLPEGKYKIQRQVRDWAKSVNHADRAATVAELVKVYRNTLPAIQVFPSVTVAQATTVESLARTGAIAPFAGASEAWQPFNAQLDARIAALRQSGQVTTVAQFIEMGREIATGLDAAVTPAEQRAAVVKQLQD